MPATAYTPTTTQPITNYIPVLQTASANVARFDHNPVTGESLGFLVEEQRTNLLTYSEEFDNAAWTKFNGTITANTIVAPDGTLTGDKLVEDTATAIHYLTVNGGISVTSGTSYTFTVFAKAASTKRLSFVTSATGFTTNRGAIFDLNAGTISDIAASTTATITNVGNGFYRCAITATATSTGVTNINFVINNGTSSLLPSYAGNGFDGIYIWGAQLEAGAFPTSYIKTVASQVTRSADSASMTGANFSEWYRQDEGTVYVEASTFATDGAHYYFALTDGGNANGILAYRFGSSVSSDIFNNNVLQFRESIGAVPLATPIKLSSAYKFNNSAFSRDGSVSTTDTSCVIPVLNRLNFGVRGDALQTTSLDGHIRKLSYYPARLTNEQLVALTS